MTKLKFEKYEQYRSVSHGDLNEIPFHWNEVRLKDIAVLERGKFTHRPRNDPQMYDGVHPFIQTGDVTGAIKYVISYKQTLSDKGTEVSKKFKKGTLVMTIAANIGDVAIIDFDTYFPDSLVGFQPRKSSVDFLFYLFSATKSELNRVKVTSTQDNLNLERLNSLVKFIPPLEEQKAIAVYLDVKTAQIDRKIELLEQKAEKYTELKKALITDSVTHGLDKTVPMRDSGLKWVAQIPAHWEIKRAKDLFKKMSRSASETDGIITAFRDGQVTLRENRRTSGFTNAILEHGYQGIRVGDLVIHAMDGFAGAIGVSDSDGKSSPVYSAYTPADTKKVYNPYYGLLVREMALSGFVASLGKGIRERSSEFRHKEFAPLELPVPPLKEQKAIADYLKDKITHIEKIIETIRLEIEKLKELRKTLINDVVTGKIKVI